MKLRAPDTLETRPVLDRVKGMLLGFVGFLAEKFEGVAWLLGPMGPVLIGVVVAFTDEPRFILVTVLPMFVLGALLLAKVETRDAT